MRIESPKSKEEAKALAQAVLALYSAGKPLAKIVEETGFSAEICKLHLQWALGGKEPERSR